MDNLELAEAVAWLLPKSLHLSETDVFAVLTEHKETILLTTLAFECHKALCELCAEVEAAEFYDYREYTYNHFKGKGETHEEAIFAAAQDAYDKREKSK